MINLWDYWDREWNRAKAFFKSKGNTKTLSRLKDKWNKELFIDFKKIGKDSWDSALKEAKKVHMQVDEFTSFDEYLKKEHPKVFAQ